MRVSARRLLSHVKLKYPTGTYQLTRNKNNYAWSLTVEYTDKRKKGTRSIEVPAGKLSDEDLKKLIDFLTVRGDDPSAHAKWKNCFGSPDSTY
jgi:hypothetical protein